jgi:hypothetical protein
VGVKMNKCASNSDINVVLEFDWRFPSRVLPVLKELVFGGRGGHTWSERYTKRMVYE